MLYDNEMTTPNFWVKIHGSIYIQVQENRTTAMKRHFRYTKTEVVSYTPARKDAVQGEGK